MRNYLKKNTIIDLEDEKDGDKPPITSVTPTDQLPRDEKYEELLKLVREKIPKPRGRPKKQ